MRTRRCDGCGSPFVNGMHERVTKTHDGKDTLRLCEWCALEYEAEREQMQKRGAA